MFDFLDMLGNYENRAVDHYESNGLIIDTCRVSDSAWPFETAISHPKYNQGKWVVVAGYHSKEEALAGHQHWLVTMTAAELPVKLVDVSTAGITIWADMFGSDWRDREKEDHDG